MTDFAKRKVVFSVVAPSGGAWEFVAETEPLQSSRPFYTFATTLPYANRNEVHLLGIGTQFGLKTAPGVTIAPVTGPLKSWLATLTSREAFERLPVAWYGPLKAGDTFALIQMFEYGAKVTPEYVASRLLGTLVVKSVEASAPSLARSLACATANVPDYPPNPLAKIYADSPAVQATLQAADPATTFLKVARDPKPTLAEKAAAAFTYVNRAGKTLRGAGKKPLQLISGPYEDELGTKYQGKAEDPATQDKFGADELALLAILRDWEGTAVPGGSIALLEKALTKAPKVALLAYLLTKFRGGPGYLPMTAESGPCRDADQLNRALLDPTLKADVRDGTREALVGDIQKKLTDACEVQKRKAAAASELAAFQKRFCSANHAKKLKINYPPADTNQDVNEDGVFEAYQAKLKETGRESLAQSEQTGDGCTEFSTFILLPSTSVDQVAGVGLRLLKMWKYRDALRTKAKAGTKVPLMDDCKLEVRSTPPGDTVSISCTGDYAPSLKATRASDRTLMEVDIDYPGYDGSSDGLIKSEGNGCVRISLSGAAC